MPTPPPVKVIATAPPPPPAAPPVAPPPPAAEVHKPEPRPYGTWVDVYAGYEARNGILPSEQVTVGVMAGQDVTYKNGFQLGVLAGFEDTNGTLDNINNADTGVHGVFGAGYLSFASTNFSFDLLAKLDLFEFSADCVDITVAPPAVSDNISRDVTNYTLAVNLNYRIDIDEEFSIEPTFGFRYTFYSLDDGKNTQLLGIEDGQVFRLQLGARARRTWWFDHHDGHDEEDEDDEHDEFDRSLTVMAGALVYSDLGTSGFVAEGLGLAGGAGSAADDELQLRIRAMLGINANLSEGLSAYARAEAYGGKDIFALGGDLIGFSGRVGAKYQW